MESGISGANPVNTLPELFKGTQAFTTLYDAIVKLPCYDSVSNNLQINEVYEQVVGYRNNRQLPMALNMKGDKLFNIESIYEEVIFKLIKYEVPTLSNTSIPELLKLPKFDLYTLVRSCKRYKRFKNAIEANIGNDLGKY